MRNEGEKGILFLSKIEKRASPRVLRFSVCFNSLMKEERLKE